MKKGYIYILGPKLECCHLCVAGAVIIVEPVVVVQLLVVVLDNIRLSLLHKNSTKSCECFYLMPVYKFSCPYHLQGCLKQFQSQSGCTYHVQTAHGDNHNKLHNHTGNGPENEAFHDGNHNLLVGELEGFFAAAEYDNLDVPPTPGSPTLAANGHPPTLQRNIHPHLNGIFY